MTMSSLRERLGAVEAPRPPADTAEISWRAATIDDVPAVLAFYGALASADHPEWVETLDEIDEEFRHPWVDLARDTLIGETADGFVAFGHVMAPPDPETIARSILFGGVHPEHRGRGLGPQLLAWQRQRAREQLAAVDQPMPGWIMGYAEERTTDARNLFARAGMPLVRWFSKLERDLSDPIPEIAVPDGLRFELPRDADREAVRVAKNEAFRDHWGSQPTSAEQWHSGWSLPTRAVDLSLVAWDGDRVVGFVETQVNPDDFERQGYVGGYVALVGVVRDWRRRGVAPAMLAEVMRAARAAGHERIALDVDSENPTGALGLYTGMGFVATSRSVAHVEEL